MAKMLLRAGLVGLLLAAILIAFDSSQFLSRSSIYEQIELGMTERQATEILYSNEIRCLDAWATYHCTFDDYWRMYTVTFDAVGADHLVVRKTIAYKQHRRSAVRRLFKFLHLIR